MKLRLVILLSCLSLATMAFAQASGGQIRRHRKKQSSTVRHRSVTQSNVPPKMLSCPNDNHPHMIDLGLPSGTKWACCNLGASTPEQRGDYYRWGETKPVKEGDTDATYPYKNVDIGNNIAGTKYDAATANWGASWRMPTEDQIMELVDNCTYKWTMQNGQEGVEVTGRNGGTIFLPASGYRNYSSGSFSNIGSSGYYWSSSPWGTDQGEILYFHSSSWYWNYYTRAFGFPVRPVAK